jgi:hypothetical protein
MGALRERIVGAAGTIILVWATYALICWIPPLMDVCWVPVLVVFLFAESLVTAVEGPAPSPGIDIPMLPRFHEHTGVVAIILVTLAAGSIGFVIGTPPLRRRGADKRFKPNLHAAERGHAGRKRSTPA